MFLPFEIREALNYVLISMASIEDKSIDLAIV